MSEHSGANIQNVTHPEYGASVAKWNKFRKVFEGGDAFKVEYLEKFSLREGNAEFDDRLAITPVPSHAKAAVVDIKNAIYQRLVDIVRTDGPKSWQDSVNGKNGGVDFAGNSMTGYIGRLVLPELLSMGKVGVFVDKPVISGRVSLADTRAMRPYIYKYNTEDIRGWSFDDQNQLTTLLLRDHIEVLDAWGLVESVEARYRLLKVTPEGVTVEIFNDEPTSDAPIESFLLSLKEIPFAIFEISQSLLEDVADHQIALLNMGSSDVNYAIKSNFPFYTEQINPLAHLPNVKQPGDTGEATESGAASTKEVKVGVTQGRGYPKGLERPGFIHPSSEPLLASMKKQSELREEIRLLVNLSLTNIEPRRASAESKALDEHSLEAGLSYIGLELEYGERRIAQFWSAYERSEPSTINYPTNYSLRSEEDRRQEAKELSSLQDKVPSATYQKALAKEIALITISNKVDDDLMATIHQEIDKAPTTQIDSKTILADHKSGLVSTELASKLRGYPEGEAEKAAQDHADRILRIKETQGDAEGKGNNDEDIDPDASVKDKEGKAGRSNQKQPTSKEKLSDV